MTRLGYQIPNFNYPDSEPADIFSEVVRQAKAAEASGFDTIFLMDHFYQLPQIGPPTNNMLECYTVLSALAQHTSKVRLSALVTGNTYRNPGVLAKTLTALDIVSGGRAQLGIGAGWYEEEHNAFGIEFGTFTDRFEKLEEALQIIIPMLSDERPSLDGKHYQVRDIINQPAPISNIPIMIGGSGEKKTLRMVAQYANESNIIAAPDEIQRKLDALQGHCDRLGRDRSEITVSWHKNALIAPTMEEARADLTAYLATIGMDYAAFTDEQKAGFEGQLLFGDPDTVGEALEASKVPGVDGFTFSLATNGHLEGRVEMLGAVASRVIG